MKWTLIQLALVVWVQCALVASSTAAESELVWVARNFTGGKQCDPLSHYSPPSVKQILRRAGINVYEMRIEYLAVCAACSCPSYAALHYAQIPQNKLDAARRVGFEQKTRHQI